LHLQQSAFCLFLIILSSYVEMWRKSHSTGVCYAPDRREGSKFARNTGNPAENKHVLLSHDLGRVWGRDCGLCVWSRHS